MFPKTERTVGLETFYPRDLERQARPWLDPRRMKWREVGKQGKDSDKIVEYESRVKVSPFEVRIANTASSSEPALTP
jgi:hypothetical protein